MGRLDDLDHVHCDDRTAWRAWLEANHATSPGIWLVRWKPSSGRPALTFDELVEEALCFGWIDSRAGTVDADRNRIVVTPRRPGSGWSKVNKERIARLEAAGRLAPAGRAAIEAARRDGSWTKLDEAHSLVVPDDLAAAFAAHPDSREQFDAFPPSARRAILEWVTTARRPETRARRVERVAAAAAVGERANQPRRRS
jgi:uncharacterized protein YdeI (YjbR/CyaY-like superfamily)